MDIEYSLKSHPYKHWEYLDIKTGNRLRVVPERGGLITEWKCQGKELLYFDLDRFSQKEKSVRGGIPILFPICGDLPSGKMRFPEGDFVLPQHGFARDNVWQISLLPDRKGIKLIMCENNQTLALFPFSFMLEIEARLIHNTLQLIAKIHNRSLAKMPFSLGFHPYFNVSNLNKIEIKGLPEKCLNHLSMREVNTSEEILKLEEGIDLLVNAQSAVKIIDLLNKDSIKLEQQSPMDLTVLWTDPPRQMICLEPWTSPRQSLISGDRKLQLNPGETCILSSRFVYNELNLIDESFIFKN